MSLKNRIYSIEQTQDDTLLYSSNPKQNSWLSFYHFIKDNQRQTTKETIEDASFKNINEVKQSSQNRRSTSTGRSTTKNKSGRYTVGTNKKKSRDNSSRFDD